MSDEGRQGGMDTPEARFEHWFAIMPIVAILRGLKPDEAVPIGEALVREGIHILEVPLNSPDPLASIGALAKALAGRAIVGAGTVLDAGSVDAVADVGGEIVVSPNTDAAVIRRTRERGLVSLPGSFTPTEAFAALAAGAHAIKLFPGELVTPQSARGLAAVLPRSTRILVVGGVSPDTMKDWRDAPVQGFGIGSSLFKPGVTPDEIAGRAQTLAAAVRQLAGSRRQPA